jgi:hypothetical protein
LEQARLGKEQPTQPGTGSSFFGGKFASLGDSQFASLSEAMAAVPERSTEPEGGAYGPFHYKLGKGAGSI